jgi:hypothetical protein
MLICLATKAQIAEVEGPHSLGAVCQNKLVTSVNYYPNGVKVYLNRFTDIHINYRPEVGTISSLQDCHDVCYSWTTWTYNSKTYYPCLYFYYSTASSGSCRIYLVENTETSNAVYNLITISDVQGVCASHGWYGLAGSSMIYWSGLACATGTYKAGTGSAPCAACPTDSSNSAGATSVASCLCNAGYTGPDGGPCVACVANEYKASSGSAACTTCPTYSVSLPASTSANNCTCNAGYTGLACAACTAGTYKVSTGSEACTACPDNTNTLALGAESILACVCNAGYQQSIVNYGSGGSGSTGGWRMGTTYTQTWQYYWDIPLGRLRVNWMSDEASSRDTSETMTIAWNSVTLITLVNTGCRNPNCYYTIDWPGPGTITLTAESANNALSTHGILNYFLYYEAGDCEICAAGTYKSNSGSEACASCPADSYNSVAGSTSCTACPADLSSVTGSTSLNNCMCNAGYTGPDGSGPCEACEEGKYKSIAGSETCTTCPENTMSPTASTSSDDCDTCIDGYEDLRRSYVTDPILPLGTNLARACGVNFDSRCATASSGVYSNWYNSYINDGTGLTYHSSSTGAHYVRIDLGRDVDITQIRFTNRADCCKSRIRGAYLRIGTEAQLGRTSFTSANENSFLCARLLSDCDTQCVKTCNTRGRYIYITHSGQYLQVREIEVFGFGGLSPAPDLAFCAACTTSQVIVSPSTKCVCASGSYDSSLVYDFTDKNSFLDWTAYADAIGATHNFTEYDFVIPGLWIGGTPQGYIQLVMPSGYEKVYVAFGSSYTGGYVELQINGATVSTATAGKYQWYTDVYTAGQTLQIVEISYSMMHADLVIKFFNNDVCEACPSHLTTIADGATSVNQCVFCNAGYTGPDGGPCVACELGTYKAQVGSAACSACTTVLNYSTTTGTGSVSSASCVCNMGYNLVGSVCQACATGYYKNLPGNSTCTVCPRDFQTTIAIGSDSIALCVCVAGYASTDTSGTAMCVACDIGKFQNLNANGVACVSCSTGGTTLTGASWSASQCIPLAGYFKNAENVFQQCPANTYRPYDNQLGADYTQTSCIPCPHLAESVPGSDDLTDCTCSHPHVEGPLNGHPCTCRAGFYEVTASCSCENLPSNGWMTLSGYERDVASASLVSVSPVSNCEQDPNLATAYQIQHDGTTCYGWSHIALVAVPSTTAVTYLRCQCPTRPPATQTHTCEPCPADFFCPAGDEIHACPMYSTSQADSFELAQCQCDAGRFLYTDTELGSNLGVCMQCAAGTFSENNTCTACPTNTVSTDGSSSIDNCAANAGFYGTGNSVTACPGESTSTAGATVVSECLCNAGYTGTSDTACVACGNGKYKASIGSAACTDCPLNSHHLLTGEGNASNCVCNIGYSGTGDSCTACAADTYKDTTGSAACTACADSHENSPVGSTSEAACICNAGFYANAGACVGCAVGKYKNSAGDANTCVNCPSNTNDLINGVSSTTISPGQSSITACLCPAGATSSSDAENCVTCAVDTYKSSISFAACDACPLHTGTAERGATIFSQCKCNAGYSADIVTGGNIVSITDLACAACQPGTYKATRGTAPCLTCPSNSHSSETGANTCSCNAGFEGDFLACTPCATGTFKDVNSTICNTCPDFSTSMPQSTSIEACHCNAGYETIDGDTCLACSSGKYKEVINDDIMCQTCSANSQSQQSTASVRCVCNSGFQGTAVTGSDCVLCNNTSYKSSAGTEACTQCLDTQHTSVLPRTQQSDCHCNVGYTGTDISCTACGVGEYKSTVGNVACDTCIDSTHTLSASTTVNDCVCNAGFIGANGNCQQCTAGKYSSANNCQDCPLYSDALAGSDDIVDCTCNTGYTRSGDTCDISCGPGFEGDEISEANSCIPCSAGKYKSTTGSETCLNCPAFSTHFLTQQSTELSCVCNQGYTKVDGATGNGYCLQCASGTFNNFAGETRCYDCAVATNGLTCSSISVSAVPAGMGVTGQNIFQCSAGTWNDGTNLQCQSCPVPSSNSGPIAAISPDDCYCAAGYERNAASVCTACAQGTYKPVPDTEETQTTCLNCPPLHNTIDVAANSYSQCYCDVNVGGTTDNCVECSGTAVKYIIANLPCIDCPAHSTLAPSDDHLHENCLCDPGFTLFNSATSSETCELCEDSTYKETNGNEACISCGANTISSLPRTTRTDCACSPGFMPDPDNAGPDVDGGTCVSACTAGETFDASSGTHGACVPCAGGDGTALSVGTYKTTVGTEACTLCTNPRNASLPGATAADQCRCMHGSIGLDTEQVLRIVDIGAFTATQTFSLTDQNFINTQVVMINLTVTSTSFRATLHRYASSLLVAECDNNCPPSFDLTQFNPVRATLTVQGSCILHAYTHVSLTFEYEPTWFTTTLRTEAEQLAVQKHLTIGAIILKPDEFYMSLEQCVACPPGVLCALP